MRELIQHGMVLYCARVKRTKSTVSLSNVYQVVRWGRATREALASEGPTSLGFYCQIPDLEIPNDEDAPIWEVNEDNWDKFFADKEPVVKEEKPRVKKPKKAKKPKVETEEAQPESEVPEYEEAAMA